MLNVNIKYAIITVVAVMIVTGCSTVAKPTRSQQIDGDSELRKKVKFLAVIGFIGSFDLESGEDRIEAFKKGAPKQNLVEYQFRAVLDALADATQFKLIPHKTVAASEFYETMAVNETKGPIDHYDKTCPEGLREIRPRDTCDFRALCDDLKCDALFMFRSAYRWEDMGWGKREGVIVAAECVVRDRDGNILYRQSAFDQPSGPRFFWWKFLFGSTSAWDDVYLTLEASRIFARDFVAVFENRLTPDE